MQNLAHKIITINAKERKNSAAEDESTNYSRDEMNLVEFPLTVLSNQANPAVKTLEFQDTAVKDNKVIHRKWVITGADKFGLPTASDDEVLLGLMKLSADDHFQNRKVYFTRYALLRALHWTTEGRSYSRLQNALDRLSGVRVKAVNAFYDRTAEAFTTKNFGIVDSYEINDGRESGLKPSFFTWSEEIFNSFKAGYIRRINLNFYLGLQSAVTKRLYRFLDKRFWYKGVLEFDLFTLAHEKIGISRNYKYASSIRQHLDPSIQELIDLGYLSHCEYVGKGKNVKIILYSADGAKCNQGKNVLPDTTERGGGLLNNAKENLAESGDNFAESDEQDDLDLAEKLVQRGIKTEQVTPLLVGKTPEELKKIASIIEYFDYLIASGSHLISKSPVGFLYSAVKNCATFTLPNVKAQGKIVETRKTRPAKKRNNNAEFEKKYFETKTAKTNEIKDNLDPDELANIRRQIEKSLASVKGIVSDEHFQATVEQRLNDEIINAAGFPPFKDWVKEQRPGDC